MNPGPYRGALSKIGLILLIGLIQSVTIAAVGIARDSITPGVFTALRVSIASLALAGLLCLLRPQYRWQLRPAADMVILGLLNVATPFLLLAVALAFITTSLAAALFQIAPVLTVILASIFLPGERLNAIRAVGTVVAVAGAIILVLGGASSQALGRQALAGQALIAIASLAAAAGVVYARARTRDVDTLVLAAGQMFAALAIIAPLALIVDGSPAFAAYSLPAWAATIIAALGTPVLGFWLLYYVVERYSASLAGFTGVATPLFSAAIGIAFLDEVFTLPMAIGALLLVGGVLIFTRT